MTESLECDLVISGHMFYIWYMECLLKQLRENLLGRQMISAQILHFQPLIYITMLKLY